MAQKTKQQKYDEQMAPYLAEGKAAALAGQPWSVCPYDFELDKRNAWLVGHKNGLYQLQVDITNAKREAEEKAQAELSVLRRKAAAFDYIEKNHTSSGGMHMSGLQTIVLGRPVGMGRTLLEAIESKMEQST